MKKLIEILTKHQSHSVEIVETPTKIHYAKLCCQTCGNRFLTWLGPDELLATGHIKDRKQYNQMVQAKKLVRERLKQQKKATSAKKNTRWAQAKTKEKQFYHSYQPRQQKFGTSFLLGDRLTLAGRYTGNPLALIPIDYLKTLIATDTRLPNPKDREIIRQHISIRQTGSYPAPLEAV